MKNKILVVLLVLIIVINTICCFLLIKNKGGNKMASIKISELNAKTQADDSDLIPIVDSINSETKKITKGNLINDVYSTSEVKTNKVWTNGLPIYRKIVDTGEITDLSRWDEDGLLILNAISNIGELVSIEGYGYGAFKSSIFPLHGYSYLNDEGYSAQLKILVNTQGDIVINSTGGRPYREENQIKFSYVIVEYTKDN